MAGDAAKLLSEAEGLITAKESPLEIMKTCKAALRKYRGAKDKKGEATALATIVKVHLLVGGDAEAQQAAKDSLKIYKELKDDAGQAAAWKVYADTLLVGGNAEGALNATKEALKLFQAKKDEAGEASVWLTVASAHILKDLDLALEGANKAFDLFNKKKDAAGKASALDSKSKVLLAQGKAAEALKAANEALEACKGEKDKSKEASITLTVAKANMAQKDYPKARSAAEDAAKLYDDAKDVKGKAAALHTSAQIAADSGKMKDGLKLCKEAGDLYRKVGDRGGELEVESTMGKMHEAGQAPLVDAKFMLDSATGVAILEIHEMASESSMEKAINVLYQLANPAVSSGLTVLVMHITGSPRPKAFQTPSMQSGNMVAAMRSIGVPIVCAIDGRVSGMVWNLFLASDYRIAANSATFETPCCGGNPPDGLTQLVGESVAKTLLMGHRIMSSIQMSEIGVLHETRPNIEGARTSAEEMGRRLSAQPYMACRQYCQLVAPAIEKYVNPLAIGFENPL
eukprot:gnl/TRDRNA2_/TRDRNA2_180760_c0_seq1.p1 gnl/TRDRNA2_/TRDRNA2_180760_c0~~gnl/TRDRNA2_/TRDRNA2_180760_c0_seq1.p1  ORF type:complete len:514 (+),score=140.03 gnl/TRDRNA2_/TRDRNA2_180760_c0_seq1:53-1594(+)